MADSWLHPPVPLVALIGMDDIHKPIIGNMPKAKRLNLISHKMEAFPIPIDRKDSEIKDWETYPVRGIIRSEWVEMHMNKVPAVICLLYEWDESKDWHSQTIMVTDIVNAFRARNAVGTFEILVVIVRHRNSNEDEAALEDKHRSMCREAGISTRNLLLLTTTDLKNSLKRLEEYVHAVAIKKYKEAYKATKREKDRIPRSITRLQVRYNFKMGFFAELYSDQGVALSHYTQAYTYLTSIKVNKLSEEVIELKVVAQVIVFKIIYLLLNMNRVSEALIQFRHHIANFRSHQGIPSLHFHHYAWLSKQFRAFGEFWEAAPAAQRYSTKTQNSGYFYLSAAEHALRRKSIAKIALQATGMMKSDDNTKIPVPEFLGHVLTQAEQTYGSHSSNSAKASQSQLQQHLMVQRLLVVESKHDHSDSILTLLTRAYENFKRQRCTRMILHVASRMAKEYLSSGNPAMAQRFYDRIARTYRNEKWTPILSHILMRSLECARKLNLTHAATAYSIELLAMLENLPWNDRVQVAKDLAVLRHVSIGCPRLEPPPCLSAEAKSKVWADVASMDLAKAGDTATFPVPTSLITCEAGFVGAAAEVKDESKGELTPERELHISALSKTVKLRVTLKSQIPVSFEFAKICIVFKSYVKPITILPKKKGSDPGEYLGGKANTDFDTETIVAGDTLLKSMGTLVIETNVLLPTPESKSTQESTLRKIQVSEVFLAQNLPEIEKKGEEEKAKVEGKEPKKKGSPTPIIFKCGNALLVPMNTSTKPSKDEKSSLYLPHTVVLTQIKPKARISFTSYFPPGIVGEEFPLTLSIDTSGEPISNASLSIHLRSPPGGLALGGGTKSGGNLTNLSVAAQNLGIKFKISGRENPEEIKVSDDTKTVKGWIRASSPVSTKPGKEPPAPLSIVARLQYTNPTNLVMCIETSCPIWWVQGLSANFRIFPLSTPKISKGRASVAGARVLVGEPFLVHTILENVSSHTIKLSSASLETSKCPVKLEVVSEETFSESKSCIARLGPKEKLTSTFMVRAKEVGPGTDVSLRLVWNRCKKKSRKIKSGTGEWKESIPSNSEDEKLEKNSIVEGHIPVPNFAVIEPLFRVYVDTRRTCNLYETVPLVLRISNLTFQPEKIEISMIQSAVPDDTSISGPTEGSCFVPPRSTHDLRFNVTVCRCGSVPLPEIKLYSRRYGQLVYDQNDVGSIFVIPAPLTAA
mmetsp:Transcript_2650/g.3829  ORF Transcript_2650/g.3829 Transcript_2650/m.3829 type:complete len:1207 (-) Transcript_2650:88-3708(-)